jgi:YhgE/Pip-like protein
MTDAAPIDAAPTDAAPIDAAAGPQADPAAPSVPVRRLLGVRKLWMMPAALAGILILLISLIYIGSVVDPTAHMHDLPVVAVNQDQGGSAAGQQVNVGGQVVDGLEQAPGVTSRLDLRTVGMAEAKHRMDTDRAFAAIVIPADFTQSLLDLYGAEPASAGGAAGSAAALPGIQILTNQRAGSVGTTMATSVAQPAIAAIMKDVAAKLTALAGPGAAPSGPIAALRASPVAVTATPYRPLPEHSALGLSAFYVALLTLMCGFLGATITNSSVDSAVGYAPTEIGPKWRLRRPLPISRRSTLLTKWAVAAGLAPILTALMLAVAIGVLHMYAPNVLILWLFCSFAAIVVALGTLVLFAMFGSLGQLLAMILFLYLSLASSGGTIPLNALPGFLRFMGEIEPLRQILGAVRSIMYFDMSGEAGLTRGLVMTGIGLVFWLLAGFAVTAFYDRRGLRRLDPEVLAYIDQSIAGYPAHRQAQDAQSPQGAA